MIECKHMWVNVGESKVFLNWGFEPMTLYVDWCECCGAIWTHSADEKYHNHIRYPGENNG